MRTFHTRTLALVAILLATTASAQRVRDFSEAIDAFQAVPAVQPFFDNAYGYVVWRRIARGGFGIGGATGRGQVYVNGEVTGFSRLIDVSVGFQLGGQVYRQIIFFENKAAYDDFTDGGYEFDAQAAAIAVTASAQASSGTQGSQAAVGAATTSELAGASAYHNSTRVFTIARGGLMYQVTIAGQRYNFRPLR